MYKLETERDQLSQEERSIQEASRRRAQAELLSCWWQESPETSESGVFIQNKSGAPVYHAHIVLFSSDGRSELLKFQVGVLPPKADAEHFTVESPDGGGEDGSDFFRVRLTFTDAKGVRWERNQYGHLTDLSSEVLVQTDMSRASAINLFRDDFMNTYGVAVDFEEDVGSGAREKFIRDSLDGKLVPDAIIAPHDWIGSFADHGVLESTTLSVKHRSLFPGWALDALTYKGGLYGLPTTLDAVALIRNKELVPEVPTTVEEMITLGLALRDSGRVDEVLCLRIGDQGDPFQIWPIFSSAGGRVLGRAPEAPWDRSQVLLDSEESVNALETIGRMGERGSGILRRTMDAREALGIFCNRRSAFLISTSDGLRHARRSGVPTVVSPVPPFAEGGSAVSLTLVHGLMMARRGRSKLIAHDLFSEHLAQASVMQTLSSAVVAPAARNGINKGDTDLDVYQGLCKNGTMMPSFHDVHLMWSVLGEAQAAVVSGEPARKVAVRAASRLRAYFSANQ
ncbi:extracellular solute-binding protein [Nocardiopsis sp. YSL2]|uniref:sugar ABC transporter substrate-binding protein n=1 Tax=Nocardiopsis sp. YSL2 TaxID=2939492 RepID=UPI0026F41FC3|nr:extracellular solute-binding protein [Nocardiopsis sp. YSL2]